MIASVTKTEPPFSETINNPKHVMADAKRFDNREQVEKFIVEYLNKNK